MCVAAHREKESCLSLCVCRQCSNLSTDARVIMNYGKTRCRDLNTVKGSVLNTAAEFACSSLPAERSLCAPTIVGETQTDGQQGGI